MTLINKKAQTVQVKAINKLIDKYGHNCQIVTGEEAGVNTRLIFGKSKAALESGTLINSNTYRLLIKIVPGMPAPVPASSHVFVNGISFFVQTVGSLGPNAADPIVYELTCAAGAVPADPEAILAPTVASPADNTSDYAYVSTDGTLYSVTVSSSAMVVDSGSPVYVSADWQIATDSGFTSIVDSASAVSGYTWTSGETLSRDTNYYVRVRHNATGAAGAIVSAWSADSLFSLDTITEEPLADIHTPTMLTTITGFYLTGDDVHYEYSDDIGGYLFKVYPTLSAFVSDTGKVYDHTHWQLSYSPTFASGMVFEGDSTGGYDTFSSTVYSQYTMVQPTAFEYGFGQMYVRGKQVATDSTESDWSGTLAFYLTT